MLNHYLDQNDPSKVVCQELARYSLLVRPEGYLILWDSTFSPEHEFYFGDQEEMGLGFRVATPLRVDKKSRKYHDVGPERHDPRRPGPQEWPPDVGNASDWCDYSGTIDGRHVGITIFCHPDNFRPSWFHARDYGLLVANPFGRRRFRQGATSKVVVKPGETLRLRYGVLLHSGAEGSRPELEAAYVDYIELTR